MLMSLWKRLVGFSHGHKALAAMLVMLFCFSALKSDEVILKSGIRYKRGRILRIADGNYIFRTSRGKVITIPGNKVARARFSQRKKEKARFHYIPGWPRIRDKDATSNDRLIGYTMLTSFGAFSLLSVYFGLQSLDTSAKYVDAQTRGSNEELTKAEHDDIREESNDLESQWTTQTISAAFFGIAAIGVYVWHYYDDFELTRVSQRRPATTMPQVSFSFMPFQQKQKRTAHQYEFAIQYSYNF